MRTYGAYLLDEDPDDGVPFGTLAVDASWLDATGADGGVGCLAGSLTSARFVAPAGGAFGARGVVDTTGAMATHVVIEPDDATPPAGETDVRPVPSDGREPASSADPAAGEPGSETAARPEVKPAAATTTTATVTKTSVTNAAKPKPATTKTASLPKTGDNCLIAASMTFFLLGITLLGVANRCCNVQ